MSGFGGYNSFPFKFGGSTTVHEYEHRALLTAFDKVLDAEEATESWCEAYAEGLAVAMIWAINRRLANQMQPMKMMENLPVWESASRVKSNPGDNLVERRTKLEAKMRAATGNAPPDVEAVCRSICGTNFESVEYSDETNHITYWPGVNPGPPGFEWASTRSRFGVVVTQGTLSDSKFYDMRQEVAMQLNDTTSSWSEFTVGVEGPFTLGLGIVGRTLL